MKILFETRGQNRRLFYVRQLLLYFSFALLAACAIPQYAAASAKGTLTYRSSNPGVASVSKTGKVTMKNCGTAGITITAAATSGYKKAEKTITLNIVPGKVTGLSLTSKASGALTVKWKKASSVSGHQVQCAVSSSFASSSNRQNYRSLHTKKTAADSMNIKKLRKNTRYFVRVRSFKKVNGRNVYGPWSSVKKITVK